jgi:hypothetical protein
MLKFSGFVRESARKFESKAVHTQNEKGACTEVAQKGKGLGIGTEKTVEKDVEEP